MPNRPVIVAADGTWVVRAGGAVIGESSRALELIEADGPGVIFFPREDLGMAFLEGSETVASSAALGEARLLRDRDPERGHPGRGLVLRGAAGRGGADRGLHRLRRAAGGGGGGADTSGLHP